MAGWYAIGPVLWDAAGNPYRDTSDGRKDYIPPIVAAQYRDDPRLLQWAKSHGAAITRDASGKVTDITDTSHTSGNFTGNSTWDSESGGYKKDNFFDSSLGGLILGASSIAAPLAVSALTAPSAVAPATSIPEAFGTTAVDTVTSAAPTAAAASSAAKFPDWLKRATTVGDSLSAMSAWRAEGRAAEGAANQNQARTAVDLYNSELNAPQAIARNAAKGDLLANAHDVTIEAPSTIPVPKISGGLHPDMFSPETRQTGRNITTAAANTPIPTPTAPVLPPLPQAGGLDSFLNGASIVSGLSQAIPRRPTEKSVAS